MPSNGTGGESISAAKRRKRRKKRGFNCVWLETAKALAEEHVAQIFGYLRSSRVERGLLINIGAPKFNKKYALSCIGEGSRPGGLIGGILFLFASLAPFRGLFRSGF